MRRALLILAILLASLTANAQDSVYRRRASASVTPTKQWIFGNTVPSLTGAAATRYYPISGTTTATVATTTGTRGAPMPAGTLNSLWGMTHTDGTNGVGSGNTVVLTVYKNGSSTGLTCTISGTGSQPDIHLCSGTPIDSAVTVSEGDYLEMQVVTTTGSTIPSGTVAKWGVQFDPDADNTFAYTGGVSWGAAPAGGQSWKGLGWFSTNSNLETVTRWVVPTAGTFTRMLVRNDAAQSAGQFRNFLRKNGSETALTCLISSGSTCSVTADVAVAAGDTFSFTAQTSSNGACTASGVPFACCTGAGTGSGCTSYTPAPGNTGVTLIFTPTTRGRYWYASTSNAAGLVNTSPRFAPLTGNRSWTGIEFGELGIPFAEMKVNGNPLLTLQTFYARIDNQPTSGQSWQFDLWEAPAHTTSTPTGNSRGTCTIDSTCGAAPCTCSADISGHTPLAGANGASVYEAKTSPTGTPTVPNVQVAIEVGQ